MEGGTVGLEAPFDTSQVIAGGQLQGRWETLDIEDNLLEVLWPHGLENAIHSGHGLDYPAIMNAGEVEAGLTTERRAW
jgi:hypothetical protein